MSLDQLFTKLTQAWRVQRQQIQVIGGALLVLICIVLWERNQWTQSAPADLLYDLPQAQSVYSSGASFANSLPQTSKSDPPAHWSCQDNKAWFQDELYRWQELEDLTSWICDQDFASKPLPEVLPLGNNGKSVYHDDDDEDDQEEKQGSSITALITQLQARVANSEAELAHMQYLVMGICQDTEAKSLHACRKAAATDATVTKDISQNPAVNTTLDDISSSFAQPGDTTPSPLSFEDYKQGHPGKALLGLNGIMTAPRFFTFLLWLTNSNFRLSHARQVLPPKSALTQLLAQRQNLSHPVIKEVMSFFLPGIKTAMHAQLFLDQQPLLASWVGLVGGASVAAEAYCMYVAFFSPMLPAEKFSSLICSHFILPCLNIFVSVCHMVLRLILPAVLCDALYLLHVVLMPAFTLWAHTAVWSPRLHQPQLDPILPAVQEGRRARNAFVAVWNAAVEGHQAGAARPPRPPEAVPAMQEVPGREHRSRERDHRHKEVHWPPPLAVPDHLEDAAEVPDSFKCPITFAIMKEPATTRNGLTYDRPAIMQWIQQHRRDPTTAQKLKAHHLSPNLSLRTVMQNWIDKHQ